jgi:hypothetical protein
MHPAFGALRGGRPISGNMCTFVEVWALEVATPNQNGPVTHRLHSLEHSKREPGLAVSICIKLRCILGSTDCTAQQWSADTWKPSKMPNKNARCPFFATPATWQCTTWQCGTNWVHPRHFNPVSRGCLRTQCSFFVLFGMWHFVQWQPNIGKIGPSGGTLSTWGGHPGPEWPGFAPGSTQNRRKGAPWVVIGVMLGFQGFCAVCVLAGMCHYSFGAPGKGALTLGSFCCIPSTAHL